MKHIKLFESFEDIHSICKKYKIRDYTINSDGTVDVDGHVNLTRRGLSKLPLKFGEVTGSFYCDNNRLKTLEGSPKCVGLDFYCQDNRLETLEGGPEEVGRVYICSDNYLITLKGSHKEVDVDFYFYNNPIYNIYKIFKPRYKEFMESLEWDYIRGYKIIKFRFEEACREAGIELPESISGYEYI